MNKIISYSLWGNSPKYTQGAIKNIELTKIFLTGKYISIYPQMPILFMRVII